MKTNNKKIILRAIFAILLVSTLVLIFLFSNQNGEDSSNVSKGFIYNILKFFIRNDEMESVVIFLEPIVRKLAHFSIYAMVGIWSICLVNTFEIKEKNKIFITEIFGFLYACSDEIHQSFIGERSASILDVLLDSFGVLFGIFIIIFIKRIILKKRKK